jgi:hypothetical protein
MKVPILGDRLDPAAQSPGDDADAARAELARPLPAERFDGLESDVGAADLRDQPAAAEVASVGGICNLLSDPFDACSWPRPVRQTPLDQTPCRRCPIRLRPPPLFLTAPRQGAGWCAPAGEQCRRTASELESVDLPRRRRHARVQVIDEALHLGRDVPCAGARIIESATAIDRCQGRR